MKSAFIFVNFLSITLANDLFIGEWKEDPYKRENTNNFLYARSVGFFKRVMAVNDMSWFATAKLSKDGNDSFIETGKQGYYMVDYRYHIVPSKMNKLIYNISPNPELNDIGGTFTATAELRENSWIIYLRKISKENIKSASFLETHLSLKNIDMVQIRKIDPNNPNVLINELKDVKSGTTMVSYFDKQL